MRLVNPEVIHEVDEVGREPLERPGVAGRGHRGSAEASRVQADHAKLARQQRNPRVPEPRILRVPVMQDDRVRRRPRIGEIVVLVVHTQLTGQLGDRHPRSSLRDGLRAAPDDREHRGAILRGDGVHAAVRPVPHVPGGDGPELVRDRTLHDEDQLVAGVAVKRELRARVDPRHDRAPLRLRMRPQILAAHAGLARLPGDVADRDDLGERGLHSGATILPVEIEPAGPSLERRDRMNYTILIYESANDFRNRTDDAHKGGYWGAYRAYTEALRGAGVMVGGAALHPA